MNFKSECKDIWNKHFAYHSATNINGITYQRRGAKNINFMFAIVIAIGFVVISSTYAFFSTDSEYDICVDKYNQLAEGVKRENVIKTEYCIDKFISSPYELRDCMQVLTPMPINSCVNKGTGAVLQDDTKIHKNNLRDKFGLSDCRFINDVHRMGKYNLEWLAYDISCEVGKSFDVKSPGDYTIEEIGYGANLGNYIILRGVGEAPKYYTNETRIVLGHTKTTRKQGEIVGKGDIIGQTNISGASTGIHVHIELWDGYNNVSREFALGEKYHYINGTALLNHRKWDFGQQKKDVYYFTHYDLGDVNQNDSTPCIGASGKDLCYLEKVGIRTMALTSDVRQEMGVKFGDKVRLLGDEGCEGVYQVEDEMNKRYRETPGVLRPNTPYYIKGDLPSKEGGVCSVTKI